MVAVVGLILDDDLCVVCSAAVTRGSDDSR